MTLFRWLVLYTHKTYKDKAMGKSERVDVRATPYEKALLQAYCQHYDRQKSDVLREWLRKLEEQLPERIVSKLRDEHLS